jgi:hypothetical protein
MFFFAVSLLLDTIIDDIDMMKIHTQAAKKIAKIIEKSFEGVDKTLEERVRQIQQAEKINKVVPSQVPVISPMMMHKSLSPFCRVGCCVVVFVVVHGIFFVAHVG